MWAETASQIFTTSDRDKQEEGFVRFIENDRLPNKSFTSSYSYTSYPL